MRGLGKQDLPSFGRQWRAASGGVARRAEEREGEGAGGEEEEESGGDSVKRRGVGGWRAEEKDLDARVVWSGGGA